MRQVIVAAVVVGVLWGGTTRGAHEAGSDDRITVNADPGLVGWWKLDDENPALALDASGWGRHGTVYGSPLWVPGYVGGALQVDGQDDYVDTGYRDDLPRWTVSAWVKSPRAPRTGPVGGPVHREANYQFNWDHDNSRFQGTVALHIGDTWYPASFGLLRADQWYHLAGTFDGTALRAYVNGSPITTNADAQGIPWTEPSTLKIGRHAGGPWFFLGTIDDVRVYNRALTRAEIESLIERHPLLAWSPQPARGETVAIGDVSALCWSAADDAAAHDVYLGADAEVVAAADRNSPVYWGRQIETSFSLAGLLEGGGQYFWRIDEVPSEGRSVRQGAVWSFTVSTQFVVDDFESYTGWTGSLISETWLDGSINGTGSFVGALPERTVVHHGAQSMSLVYDNTASPFYSEVERRFVPPQNWTAQTVDTVSLWIRGDVLSFAETSPGAFAMSAAGTDIWGRGDEFRFAYLRLRGDGSIVARVNSVTYTDVWAKAGVMIRQSLEPDSAHAFMLITPDGRRAFQNRPIHGSGRCLSAHGSSGSVTLPYWVKLERIGDQFTGYYSSNGINWIKQSETENVEPDASPNPQTIHMPGAVYIGLALTSNAIDAVATATFSQVQTTGYVSGPWQVAEIGVEQPGNGPGDLYVAIEDLQGRMAVAMNPDPAAVNATTWTQWKIPLSHLAGVNLAGVRRMYIGVDRRDTSTPTGAGRIYIDDICLTE